MAVCPFDKLDWECPKRGDGGRVLGHIWRISLRDRPKGVRCAICDKPRRGRAL